MPFLTLVAVTLLSQASAAPQAPQPNTPAGCVKSVRDYTIAQQRALKQVTAEAVRKIEADKQALARTCAAQFNAATIAPADLPSLVALYGESAQPDLAKAALDRALAMKNLPASDRAEVLVQAVQSGLREPKSAERNARLEAYIDSLDKLDCDIDLKMTAHTRMNGYYRGDDIDDGIIKHSTWLIDKGRTFTPEQRAKYGTSIVIAHINMAEALAGRGENDRAMDLLNTAKKDWRDIRNINQLVDPVLARYALVGTAGAPITAPRWLNAAANTTIPMTGAVTLLEFTAHWCVPCKESYPGINRLLAKYGSKGFRVVLSTELYGYFGQERPLTPEAEYERDRDYWAHEVPRVPVAIDDQRSAPVRNADGSYTVAGKTNEKAYEVGGIPQIQIIDKHGRIRLIMVGYDDVNEKALGDLIDKLLKEK
jgi:thiol-disulfide isomerase/thioredoxin